MGNVLSGRSQQLTQDRSRIRRRFTILGLMILIVVLVANLVWYGMGVFVDEMTAVGASLLAVPISVC